MLCTVHGPGSNSICYSGQKFSITGPCPQIPALPELFWLKLLSWMPASDFMFAHIKKQKTTFIQLLRNSVGKSLRGLDTWQGVLCDTWGKTGWIWQISAPKALPVESILCIGNNQLDKGLPWLLFLMSSARVHKEWLTVLSLLPVQPLQQSPSSQTFTLRHLPRVGPAASQTLFHLKSPAHVQLCSLFRLPLTPCL